LTDELADDNARAYFGVVGTKEFKVAFVEEQGMFSQFFLHLSFLSSRSTAPPPGQSGTRRRKERRGRGPACAKDRALRAAARRCWCGQRCRPRYAARRRGVQAGASV